MASVNNILSHFFSGTGKVIINLMSSLSGFLGVVVAGYILIKGADIQMAAWASTLGYSITFLFSAIAFYAMINPKKISLRKGMKILVSRKAKGF